MVSVGVAYSSLAPALVLSTTRNAIALLQKVGGLAGAAP